MPSPCEDATFAAHNTIELQTLIPSLQSVPLLLAVYSYITAEMQLNYRLNFSLVALLTCRRQVEAEEANKKEATWLFSQTAKKCQLINKGGSIQLKSREFSPITIAFSDRPVTKALALDTEEAVQGLGPALFNPSTGGPPNVVVNLFQDCEVSSSAKTSNSVVAIIVKAIAKEDGVIIYGLSQSNDQKQVSDLVSIFTNGNSPIEKVVFDHCSIFIDGASNCLDLFSPCTTDDECCPQHGIWGCMSGYCNYLVR